MRRSLSAFAVSLPTVVPFIEGQPQSKEWRMFFKTPEANNISTWHHLPYQPEGSEPNLFTFVSEIPKGTRAKLELMTGEKYNPIGQDIHKKEPGQPLRFFTYGDMPFNYGFIPRTWENPDHVDSDTKCNGDGDPIDVVQIGSTPVRTGEQQAVRVLGVLGLIDQGETDWKIIVEPLEGEYKHLGKVPAEIKNTITDWFLNYKTTDGKKQNEFAFNGEIKGAEEAIRIIHECAGQYDQLMAGEVGSEHGYWLK